MAIQGQDITYNINQLQDLLDKVNNLGDATTETAGLMSAEDKQKVDSAITQETDPTVPSWAKASDKPSYSASEVGAVPTTRKVNNKALSADVTLSASDVGALPSDTPLFSGSYDDLTNKPDIPDSLSDLSDDSTHRVVTDTEKSTWSAKSDFSGSYNDLADKPTIPAAQVQSDWNEADDTKVDYIKNKPTLGVGSSSGAVSSSTVIGIPAGGNAGQVLYKVDGSTDYSVGWTNQTTNYPSAYCTTSGSTAAKKASCTLYAAQANSYLHVLIGSNNTSASALTLNVNSEGAKPIYINGTASSSTNYTLPKGTYIVFYDGTNYYFRTDGKIQAPSGTLVSTSSTSGLIKNDGTIDTTTYISDVSGKADKVTSATNGNFAALDSNGNLTDSGHKHSDYLTSHQDLSNYVQKSNTTGLLKNDGSVDTNTYLTSAPVTSVNGQTGAVSLTLGDANVIETVKVNGSALTPDANKAVDITVPSVSGKEDTTNKVTSLSSSSTDTQYPSAKATYTYINTMLGDIETLLSNI